MTVHDKIQRALTLIEEHNKVLDEVMPAQDGGPSVYRIDAQKFKTCLLMSGASTEERLARLHYEDILKFLLHGMRNGLSGHVEPVSIAKEITHIFREERWMDKKASDKGAVISAKQAAKMSHRELIENFEPEEFDSEVGKKLRDISKGEPFLVYKDEANRILNCDTSHGLLTELRKMKKGRDLFVVDDEPCRVYRIGEIPNNYADENPIYEGRPLRPLDESCDQTNRSWAGVDKKVRQMVRVIVDMLDNPPNQDAVWNLIEMAVRPDAMKYLRGRYLEAAVEFDRLDKLGELPKLIIEVDGDPEPVGGPARKGKGPFDQGERVTPKQRPLTHHSLLPPHPAKAVRHVAWNLYAYRKPEDMTTDCSDGAGIVAIKKWHRMG